MFYLSLRLFLLRCIHFFNLNISIITFFLFFSDVLPQVFNELTSIPSTSELKNGSKRHMSEEEMEGHKVKIMKFSEDGSNDQLK